MIDSGFLMPPKSGRFFFEPDLGYDWLISIKCTSAIVVVGLPFFYNQLILSQNLIQLDKIKSFQGYFISNILNYLHNKLEMYPIIGWVF